MPAALAAVDQLHGAAEVHRALALASRCRARRRPRRRRRRRPDGVGDASRRRPARGRTRRGRRRRRGRRPRGRGCGSASATWSPRSWSSRVSRSAICPCPPAIATSMPRHDTPATMRAVVPSRSWRYHAHRLVFRHLGIPPGTMRPYALPGAARLHELRWRRRLSRAPVTDYAVARGGGRRRRDRGADPVQPVRRRAGRSGCSAPRATRSCAASGCGLLYRNPGIRPERLGDLYAGHYSRFLTGAYAKDRQRRYRLVMDAFDPLFADGSGRRLLDFGCGAGLFLDLAYERGFECYGVDLSEDSIEKARAAAERRARVLRLAGRRARDRRRRVRRGDDVVGARPPGHAGRGPDDAARPAQRRRRADAS